MSGEAIQKAMTAGKDTPAASSAATSGTTPQEQNGESAPKAAARTIMRAGERSAAAPMIRSAPAALSQPASPTDSSRNGAIHRKASSVKRALAIA